LESDHRNPKNPTRKNTEPEKKRCKHSPQKKRYGDTPLGYSGRTALRRKQCNDEMPENRNIGIEGRSPLPANGSISVVLTATQTDVSCTTEVSFS
jgi:hypothetical protein